MQEKILALVKNIDVVFVSDLILIYFGVILGILFKNFVTANMTSYTKKIMKMRNFKNFSIVFITFFISFSFFGTIGAMAAISYLFPDNTTLPIKIAVGNLVGFLTTDVLGNFIKKETKGDPLGRSFKKFIQSVMSSKGVDDEDDDEVDSYTDDIDEEVSPPPKKPVRRRMKSSS